MKRSQKILPLSSSDKREFYKVTKLCLAHNFLHLEDLSIFTGLYQNGLEDITPPGQNPPQVKTPPFVTG